MKENLNYIFYKGYYKDLLDINGEDYEKLMNGRSNKEESNNKSFQSISQNNNSFFSIRTKLMQELKGEVFDYSFKGTLTKFLSTQSNIIFMLMKYRAINALALLIKVIIRRKKRINKSHGKKFTN